MVIVDDGTGDPLRLSAIEEIRAHRVRIPLTAPYRTALGDLHQLDTVICLLRAGDRWTAGEACAPTGYSRENTEQVWDTVRTVAPVISRGSPLDGLRVLERMCSGTPFARAALATALEQQLWPAPAALAAESLRLVATVNEHSPAKLADEVLAHLAHGYTTLKVKVGLDVEADIRRVTAIAGIADRAATLRLDANQQYGYGDAARLIGALDPDRLELFEQPFPPDSWELTSRLCGISEVPIMLDESIVTRGDLARAKEAGAGLVKLKLMKSGSGRDLSEDIAHARGLGLDVVVGNGVASDIGCFPEVVTCVNSGVTLPIESNGFLKIRPSFLNSPFRVSDGRLTVVQPQPAVDFDLIEEFSLA
ncbi:mandelate racemase/muconate lactonizing enzyme family protein, partial [Streptomyces sp. NPDC055078]